MINGGRLERPKLPPPQCSFDEQGRFIGHLEGLTDGEYTADLLPLKPPDLKPEQNWYHTLQCIKLEILHLLGIKLLTVVGNPKLVLLPVQCVY